MRDCVNCMWAVTERFGDFVNVVECMECKDDCPTDADFEAAKSGGYLAYYGYSEPNDEREVNYVDRL